MSDQNSIYQDNDFNLYQAYRYSLLLQVEAATFSYAIVHDTRLLVCAQNCSLNELTDPQQLSDLLLATYKKVIIGMPATGLTLMPKSLYSDDQVANVARFLDVHAHEKIFAHLLDGQNVIIYKTDTALVSAVEKFGLQNIVYTAKGWINAVAKSNPSKSKLYLNIGKETVQFLYFSLDNLRFYNIFEFKSDDELAYFASFVTQQLALDPQYITLVLSGDISTGEKSMNRLAEFSPNIELCALQVLELPEQITSHKILALAAFVIMRIIGGSLKGLRLNPPKNLPVRPTTDLAKEALFNILQNQIEFESLTVLDLFSGTGNISLEFASRGAEHVTAVDRSIHCVHYIKDTARQHGLNNVKVFKDDVFKFLLHETDKFDLVFADPPYDLNRIPEIPKILFEKNMVLPGGLLIVEHQSLQNLSNHPAFTEQRIYGHSAFSFFKAAN